jgi:hypothetical protein
MNKKVERAWSALMGLPEPEQNLAAEAILDFAEGETRPSLTAEQIAEVERRLADPEPRFLTLDEVRARFSRQV